MRYKNIFAAAAIQILMITQTTWAAGPIGGGKIESPIGDVSLSDLLARITTFLLGLSAFIAMLALVVGGVKIILGFADEKQVEEGKRVIKWAIVGLFVIGLSYVIIKTVQSLLGA